MTKIKTMSVEQEVTVMAPSARFSAGRSAAKPLATASADDELRQRIRNFMYARGVPGAESVEVEVAAGTVTISGRVPSAHAKWLCVECCRHVAGVIRLIEQLEPRGGDACHVSLAARGANDPINACSRCETRSANGTEPAPRHKQRKECIRLGQNKRLVDE